MKTAKKAIIQKHPIWLMKTVKKGAYSKTPYLTYENGQKAIIQKRPNWLLKTVKKDNFSKTPY